MTILTYFFPTHKNYLYAKQKTIAQEIIDLELEAIRIRHRISMLQEQTRYLITIFPKGQEP